MRCWRYRAFGLELESAMALPGMQPVVAAGQGDLAIRCTEDADRYLDWTGRGPVWRARLDDGTQVDLHVGRRGDHRFTSPAGAAFHLSDRAHELTCTTENRHDPTWQRLLLESVLPAASVLAGAEALRGPAVEGPDGVVALSGDLPTANAVAADLIGQGWRLFSGGALALSEEAGRLVAHPGTPLLSVRLAPGQQTAPTRVGVTVAAFGNWAWVASHRRPSGPRPLRAVLVLRPRDGRAGLAVPLPRHPLAILGSMVGFKHLPASRSAHRLRLARRLAAEVPAFQLAGVPRKLDSLGQLVDLAGDSADASFAATA